MKVFTGYLISEYVHEDDWPDIDEIFVSLDQQNRLGPQTWLVAVQGDGTAQGDTTQIGLFWEIKIAVRFAQLLDMDIELLKYYKEIIK